MLTRPSEANLLYSYPHPPTQRQNLGAVVPFSPHATLHADHIVPRSKGGKATVDNGQVLCSQHNNLKKNYGQTETCKRMYRVLYDRAVALNDIAMREFIEDVMLIYEKHGINSHIDWRQQRPDS